MTDAHHSIRVASAQSGLSSHVIRIWEKRYGAVQPIRTGTNRRLYSDGEIARLILLRLATASGRGKHREYRDAAPGKAEVARRGGRAGRKSRPLKFPGAEFSR